MSGRTGPKPYPRRAILAALALCAALAGCEDTGQTKAQAGRAATAPPARPIMAAPSGQSAELASYYRTVQSDLLTGGLLRTDGGGPDTPFDADDLVRDFEQIAFFDEYSRGGPAASGGALGRWSGPVRIGLEFGASVPPEQRSRDAGDIRNYAARLARITGHPVAIAQGKANFHVFVAGEDDRDFVQRRLKQLVPNVSQAELALFRDLPRSFYCFVVAVSDQRNPNSYARAIALIRAEHPDLVRLSCIHEEIAQGLGLPNDSPEARPSIFNDDDEFALLTTHDEMLLKMLYDPRLKPGMTAAEARPVTRIIARELTGQPL
ncbi:MAG: DUF2927 domain-containing protein [Jhaorihella sp.]